jgi:hypothetical protein
MHGVSDGAGCQCVFYRLHASCEPPAASSLALPAASWLMTMAGCKHARCPMAMQLSQTHAAAGVGGGYEQLGVPGGQAAAGSGCLWPPDPSTAAGDPHLLQDIYAPCACATCNSWSVQPEWCKGGPPLRCSAGAPYMDGWACSSLLMPMMTRPPPPDIGPCTA